MATSFPGWHSFLSFFSGAGTVQSDAAFQFIRQAMQRRSLPVDPKDVEPDYFCWHSSFGSANLLIMLYLDQSLSVPEWVVQVSAVMVRVPGESKDLLFRHCLSLNMNLVDCYFALHHEADVVLTSKRRVQGLDASGFESMLSSVSLQADQFDDELSSRFGAEMWGS